MRVLLASTVLLLSCGRSFPVCYGCTATPTPTPEAFTVFSSIVTGDGFTCATRNEGVACWGRNENGQLCAADAVERTRPHASRLTERVQLSAAGSTACAVRADTSLVCWGDGRGGQLGDGMQRAISRPVGVTGFDSSTGLLSVGPSHACAVKMGGEVQCWGSNAAGELGNGTQTLSTIPVSVRGLHQQLVVKNVAAGGDHSCALLENTASGQNETTVSCWGRGQEGQLGDGARRDSVVPTDVSNLTRRVAGLALGQSHSCARFFDGAVACWGLNGVGQLGNNSTASSSVPVFVVGVNLQVNKLVAGTNHTCALLSSGGVKCWGANEHGQLGNGVTRNELIPVDVVGLSFGVADLAAGADHTCALRTNGLVQCWGGNAHGQLGDGTTVDRPQPTNVLSID